MTKTELTRRSKVSGHLRKIISNMRYSAARCCCTSRSANPKINSQMLRGQPAGPSISRQQFLVPKIRKRDVGPNVRPKQRGERVKALSLSPPKIETKTRHEVCVCKEFCVGQHTHQQPDRTKSHSARRRPKNWAQRDSAAGADVSLSQLCCGSIEWSGERTTNTFLLRSVWEHR